MFKVAILSSVSKYSKNGIGRYSHELTWNLQKIKHKNLLIESIYPKTQLKFPRNLFFELFCLPIQIIKSQSDIFHATSPESAIAPIILNRKTIVTIHDVIYLTNPKGTKFLKRLYFKLCAKLLKRADQIITISNFSKKEIISSLKIPSYKINKIYPGIDKKFKPQINAYKNNRIGYLGGNIARKNVQMLIKAFSILKQNNYFKRHKLILAIEKDKKLYELINNLKLTGVEFKGKIPEEKIVDFYNSLSVFVYPSLYEGFGFPPLEAMACGCPVISSNNSSIPEIVGDAALLVDPTDVNQLAQTIELVLTIKNIRQTLILKGLKRCKEYTWEKTLINTLKVYGSF